MSDVWSFKKSVDGRWSWQRESLRHELIRQGEAVFAKLEDCVEDARRFGYVGTFTLTDEPLRDAASRRRRR